MVTFASYSNSLRYLEASDARFLGIRRWTWTTPDRSSWEPSAFNFLSFLVRTGLSSSLIFAEHREDSPRTRGTAFTEIKRNYTPILLILPILPRLPIHVTTWTRCCAVTWSRTASYKEMREEKVRSGRWTIEERQEVHEVVIIRRCQEHDGSHLNRAAARSRLASRGLRCLLLVARSLAREVLLSRTTRRRRPKTIADHDLFLFLYIAH